MLIIICKVDRSDIANREIFVLNFALNLVFLNMPLSFKTNLFIYLVTTNQGGSIFMLTYLFAVKLLNTYLGHRHHVIR